jgi:N-terminal acetyltransferase B complex non-catalytic subunit
LTVDAETSRASLYMKLYFEALPLGAALASTELQPADDLAILAGNAFVNLWTLSNDMKYLHSAVALLEYALTKSKQAFKLRLMLIRIYRIIGILAHKVTNLLLITIPGAPSLAVEHYRMLNVKEIQNDTLCHLILSRGSTFSHGAIGDLTMLTECLESTHIYIKNNQDVSLIL